MQAVLDWCGKCAWQVAYTTESSRQAYLYLYYCKNNNYAYCNLLVNFLVDGDEQSDVGRCEHVPVRCSLWTPETWTARE